MLLLFLLIGLLALGLPLMLFGDPPAPPPPPVISKPAIVQPVAVPPPMEAPRAGVEEETPLDTAAAPAAEAKAAPATTAPATAGNVAVSGLPEGAKLPNDAELLKELQRLLDEQAKVGK